MEDCPCILSDENDDCLDCGKHSGESDVGNITGIVNLIETTAKSHAQAIRENTDPKNPNLPRLRLVGGQLMRLPHKTLFKDLLGPSYISAKALGYRGTFERWGEMIWEATPTPANTL
jgi:hypothetical protein